jgi:hypothetical protein
MFSGLFCSKVCFGKVQHTKTRYLWKLTIDDTAQYRNDLGGASSEIKQLMQKARSLSVATVFLGRTKQQTLITSFVVRSASTMVVDPLFCRSRR